ncbi:hypothetical protein [Streptomyces djakartensis]|uniref:hypothetical protein n=1 Tax=Streptomyces djakartensis TaxID=68193 RepID=UPI0034E039A1
MHRLLPPSAIAGVSLVCALGPWVFTEPVVLRALAAAAAVTAVVGAVVLRRWDTQAGRRVADLVRARASDEWRFEERVAELEADLEESRELRGKLEQRLRAKRTELAGLRNEHAALLRRYATAESERASVLEERRVLEIEATAPVRAALPAGAAQAPAEADGAPDAPTAEEQAAPPAVFSPEGSRLFLRAAAALARFDGEKVPDPDGGGDGDGGPKGRDAQSAPEGGPDAPDGEPDGPQGQGQEPPAAQDGPQEKAEATDGHQQATAAGTARGEDAHLPERAGRQSGSAGLPERAGQTPSGHYTVPTAVAVAPQQPVRRPVAEGGFDFFGTKQGSSPAALEAVQNEDLADVVGQEALALHKAETEARFKPADEESRGIGQVIDLTAHDETEQIDLKGLRSAVS